MWKTRGQGKFKSKKKEKKKEITLSSRSDKIKAAKPAALLYIPLQKRFQDFSKSKLGNSTVHKEATSRF